MIILAIDPGPEKSAFLVYNSETSEIISKQIIDNELLVRLLFDSTNYDILAIEFVQSFGMPVGQSIFETCYWVGRFAQAYAPKKTIRIYRKEVKLHLCNSTKAKDSNIRQVLIDRFGGTREKAIGTKKKPGPLYGITKDLWSALAIAITCAETKL